MSPFVTLASLLLLLLITVCEAVDLKITNNLENGSVLTIHCKSKNDDLGIHALRIGGTFEFHFEPRFLFPTTQFYCSMDWIGASHYFDVYIYKRDLQQCVSNCWWSVKQAGPCLYNNRSGKYDHCYPWN